jgi:hypothetical protein
VLLGSLTCIPTEVLEATLGILGIKRHYPHARVPSARDATRLPAQRASDVIRRAAATSHAARTAALSEKGKPQCKSEPTKLAIQISDAERRRKILTSDECTMSFTEWDGSTDKASPFG